MNLTKIKDILYLSGVLLALIIWFSSMYGLPPRVTKLEERVNVHDNQLAGSNVKLDIVLDDVKTIKSYIMGQARER